MRRGRIGGRGRKDEDVRTIEVQGGGEKKGVGDERERGNDQ